ncbi:MAG: hypothetical protein WKG07_26745 [Hymenobacter sp.]
MACPRVGRGASYFGPAPVLTRELDTEVFVVSGFQPFIYTYFPTSD